MPVLVTGVERAVGRAVVERLSRAGGEVRVYLDVQRQPMTDPGPLRALGCKIAQGALDDEGRLESALEQVHTVMHLAGSLLCEPERLLDESATVLSAAIGAGCRRLVLLSHLGAEAADGDPWLSACHEGEALLAEAPLESIVFRRALTYGPDDDLTSALAAAGAANGGTVNRATAAARHAPLFASDLAAAVVAADRERVTAAAELHLVVAIAGPEVLRLGAVVEGLRRARRVVGAPRLPRHTAELLARDLLAPDGALGADGTPFAEGSARL